MDQTARMRWAFGVTGVSPTERLVLLVLAWHGTVSWPSVTTISITTCLSGSAVKGATARLVAKGLLEKRIRRRGGGSTSGNLYTLKMGPLM